MLYIGKHPNMSVDEDGSGFFGELSQLHLWDRALFGEEIEQMALHLNNDVGNLMSWSKLTQYIIGDVKMVKPSTVVNKGHILM